MLAGFGMAAAAGLVALVAVSLAEPGPSAALAAGSREPDARYRLYHDADDHSIRIVGRIDFGITRHLTLLLEDAEDVRLVRLQSGGGQVSEARGLVRVIDRFGLDTSALGDCASACALAFMGGRTRYLEPGARLGFHRYALKSGIVGLFMDSATEQDRDMTIFRSRGVDEAFLDRVDTTPHERMWFPTPEELVEAGVVDVLGRRD